MRWNFFNKQQKWVCGRAEIGKSCRSGSDHQGDCHSEYECQPLQKEDRWYCASPTPCAQGALPDGGCSKKLGFCLPQLSQKAKISRINLWLFIAFISIFLFIIAAKAYSPGELSSNHSFLESECQSCHSSGGLKSINILLQALQPFQHNTENALCVDCHQFGEQAGLAHNLSHSHLQALTEKVTQQPLNSTLLMATLAQSGLDDQSEKNISCISCHHEHQGTQHDLTAINDKNCQSCHQQTFTEFKDHPEFSEYPYADKTQINFNHPEHIAKNFADEAAVQPENCNDCHQPDNKGELMLSKGFDQSCRACHLKQIQGDSQAGSKGIAVFSLMGMDIETLKAKGFVTGSWPEDADSELSVFMRLLLSNDPKAVKALNILEKMDTLDLRKASNIQLQAATDLIWSIKTLLATLQSQGHNALKQSLEKSLANSLSSTKFSALVSLLPPALFNEALKYWFPLLNQELKLYQQNDLIALKQLLNAPVIAEIKHIIPSAITETIEDDLLADDGLLGGDDLDSLMADDDDDLLSLDEEDSFDEPQESSVKLTTSAEEWVKSGGWYQSYDSLYYRPSVHEDPFLKGWLDLSASHADKNLQAIFKTISKPQAPGMCLKCHTLTDDKAINWTAKRPDKNHQPFTRYAHDRHLAMAGIKNCATCHQFSQTSEKSQSFKSIEKQQCSSCHAEQKASESCTTCHNYHIGELKLKLKQTKLSVFQDKVAK